MLLSLIINIFMLITWHAKKSLADVQDGQELPDDLFKFVLCIIASIGLVHRPAYDTVERFKNYPYPVVAAQRNTEVTVRSSYTARSLFCN